jgi:hypothetical protein
MFVGHYAAAMAAKAAEPKAPLWAYVAGCQLVDIGWGALVMADIERFRFDPALPGSPLDLYHMPYTHALPSAVLWSVGAALLVRVLMKLPWAAAIMVGAAVFSHWPLDLLVHRPDLELWFGDGKVGLGLWNYPVDEMAVEIGLVAICGAAWAASRKTLGRTAWPAVLFIALLVALQLVAIYRDGEPPSNFMFGLTALIVYLVVSAIAWLVDRHPLPRTEKKAG